MTAVEDTRTVWWPSQFGADDEIGMLNHVDEAKRLQALASVRHGRVYDLGRVLDESIPVFPGRYFRQTLVSTAHHSNTVEPVGENEVNWVTEIVTGTMQLGTHLDALSHLQMGERSYNGWSVCELASPSGATHLGVETVPQIVTRGWLVDVAASRGTRRLERGDVIGVEDVGDLEPEPGDAVLFHTGWGEHWEDGETYLSGEPGRGSSSPPGSPPTVSPSRGATRGATAPCRQSIPDAPSRCPSSSTCTTACSSSRTSTRPRSPPTEFASSP